MFCLHCGAGDDRGGSVLKTREGRGGLVRWCAFARPTVALGVEEEARKLIGLPR